MKFKGFLLALVLALPGFTQVCARVKDEYNEYNEKKKQKPSAFADFLNTALGIGCIGGSIYTGIKTIDAYTVYVESQKEGFWSNLTDSISKVTGESSQSIVKRLNDWKKAEKFVFGETDYIEYVPQSELAAWGLFSGILGIAGLQFIAKGIHLKK